VRSIGFPAEWNTRRESSLRFVSRFMMRAPSRAPITIALPLLLLLRSPGPGWLRERFTALEFAKMIQLLHHAIRLRLDARESARSET